MSRTSRCLLFAALLAAPLSRADAQDTPVDSTAVLTGRVLFASDLRPAVRANVFLKLRGRGAVTDSAGAFRIEKLEPGTDTLAIHYPGHQPNAVSIELQALRAVRVTLLLSERVFEIAELRVDVRQITPGEERLARRMKAGHGAFITREQIEETSPNLASDLFRGIPRVEVTPYRYGHQTVLIGRGTMVCEPDYFVDGFHLRNFQIDDLSVDEIDTIEVYRGPSEIPTQFRGDTNRCGVIVVWTRGGAGIG